MAVAQELAMLAFPHAQLSSWGRDSTPTTACPLRCFQNLASSQGYVSPGSRKTKRENLWREFFSDPSQWWDHRSEKVSPRYPDFRHKKTRQSLWLSDNLNPAWVESELATMAPGLLDSHTFSWYVRLSRHDKAGDYKKTLNLFQQMQREGIVMDKFTFIPVLNACSNLKCLEQGKHVHEEITWRGYESDVYVASCLVAMYAKCGSVKDAWSVFSNMRERNVVSWSVMIRAYVKSGQGLKAVELFRKMQQEGVEPDAVTFVGVLNACASVTALEEGRRVHEQIIQRGCESDVYVATCLVDMYAKCGCVDDAWIVFNKMLEHDVVSWSAMILGYVKCGQGLKAMELFRKMQQEEVEPNTVTFVGVLNACSSIGALDEGRRVHEHIIQRGCESDVYVASCLVAMYAKCGSIGDAWGVFSRIRHRDVVSWSAIIGGYVKSAQATKALELFQRMQQEGVQPDSVTFVGVLNACASVGSLEDGRHVHEQIIQRGCESDVYVANCLIDMYCKCGSIEDAWSVFNKMQNRDIVSWNAMIAGYVKSQEGLKAMELFRKMHLEKVVPNVVTFVGVLTACSSVAALEEGRHVHEQINQRGFESDVYVANCLIDMYAKCERIEDAWSVFNKMQKRDVVSWNAIIGGYVQSEQGLKAMELFQKMQQEGIECDAISFVVVLNACARLAALEEGRLVHKQIIQRGCESDVYVASCLVDMYIKCGSIEDAWSVFNKMPDRNVVSWSAMIEGYGKSGQGLKAMELFRKMQQEGLEPDAITYVRVLNACASITDLDKGRHVHEQIMQSCCHFDVRVANCLIDMYVKCGSIKDAWNVFSTMLEHNVFSWNVMISGYVKCEQGLNAIKLFRKMQLVGVEPNTATFVGVLTACGGVVALEEGRLVHEQITQKGFESEVFVANCLVDMYCKCGSIEDAWSVFKKMRERDVVSWSVMIGGYAMHGHSKKAIRLFRRMGKEGMKIDEIAFTCLLSACSHGGLVKEGLRYFNLMTSNYKVLKTIEHYACMVDLLGRAGRLEEAEEITMRMPMEGDPALWMSLLGACRIHGNIEMADRAAKWLGPANTSGHVLLSNIYAAG